MNWFDQLLDIGKRDVLVLCDIRRYSDDLVARARQAVDELIALIEARSFPFDA